MKLLSNILPIWSKDSGYDSVLCRCVASDDSSHLETLKQKYKSRIKDRNCVRDHSFVTQKPQKCVQTELQQCLGA